MRFSYDGFFWRAMGKAMDMILLSFWWVLTCIPVITIIPASIALYYTAAKVLRKNVGYVTQEYFRSFRQNLKQGIGLNMLYLLIVLFLAGIHGFVEWQSLESNFGKVYYVFYLVFILVWVCVTFYLLPVLSRFQVSIFGAFRLSLYFGARNLLTMIPMVITLAGAVALCYVCPPALLFVPGFYAWLMTKSVEKALKNYILYDLPDPETHAGMWYMEE